MANGVGRSPSSDKNDSQPVSVRLPRRMVSIIDERSKEWNASRSLIIVEGVYAYIFSKKCLVCGTANPGDGKICSVCGQPLNLDEKLSEVLQEIKTDIISKSDLPIEMPGGFEPHFGLSVTTKNRINTYSVNYSVYGPDGDIFVPLDKETEYPIDREEISKRLEQKEYSVVLSNGKKMRVIFEEE